MHKIKNKCRIIFVWKGDDDVIICTIDSSATGLIEHYYNSGKSRPSYLLNSNKIIGLSNIDVQVSNGILRCSFTRKNTDGNVANYFDSNASYYLLTASGPYSNGKKNQLKQVNGPNVGLKINNN